MDARSRDIGRFLGAQLIGRGGFGAVYRAEDVEHGRDVAIKVLHGPFGERERRRFDRERQTMGRLGSHPNIMPIHDSGYTSEGEGYLVMDMATGGSLRDPLERDEPLGWREAVAVSVAVARAAQAAHDQGVLHRDIKPDNILIDAYGNYRLTDFGIAAVAGNATATTSTTATIAHAAPEVLEGAPPTPAVDIYAIASTFYNLVTGLAPFQRSTDEGVQPIIARTLTQPPPDLSPYGVPPEVAEVVERALAKRSARRQATADQLARELSAAVAAVDAGMASADPRVGSDNSTVAVTQPPQSHHGAQPAGWPPSVPPAGGHFSGQDPTWVMQPVSAQANGGAQATVGGWSDGSGGYPPAAAVGGQVPPSGGRSRIVPALALGLVLVAIGVAAVLGFTSGGEEDMAGPDPTVEAEVATVATGSEELQATTVTTEAPVTATSTSTPAGVPTTAPARSTTSVSTAAVGTDCVDPVMDAQTDSFTVTICDGVNGATYHGRKRSDDLAVDLPACYAGEGLFLAENEGYMYRVDIAALSLIVLNPADKVILDEEMELLQGTDVDLSTLNPC